MQRDTREFWFLRQVQGLRHGVLSNVCEERGREGEREREREREGERERERERERDGERWRKVT